MDATATALFEDFCRDWEAALRPCVICTMHRCPEEDQEELVEWLDAYLTTAPTPPYSEVQHERLMESVGPLVDKVLAKL
jgi:hypothetical protein